MPNPLALAGGFANTMITGAGQVTQQAASAVTNTKQEGQITDAAGPSKAEAAQSAATEKADASQARLIAMQTEADIRKQTNDVLSAIRSGKEDSANKAISAEAQNAKGISY
jgi:saccharopine dehydrogenase-like NADP-dependent oxidoreductase